MLLLQAVYCVVAVIGQSIMWHIIQQISMKRRSVLYIANFMLPILFFLALDLASFMISDNGGEKLGFQVTVLLAVTVMQLILNDILPSSSDRIPLIGKEESTAMLTLCGAVQAEWCFELNANVSTPTCLQC